MMIVETVAEESCLEEDFRRMSSLLDTLTWLKLVTKSVFCCLSSLPNRFIQNSNANSCRMPKSL
jgi:hypothetical protein